MIVWMTVLAGVLPDLGKYAVTVLLAYGASLTLLGALVAATFWRGARIRRALRAAEERQRSDG